MTTSDEWLLNHQIARAEKAEARIEELEAKVAASTWAKAMALTKPKDIGMERVHPQNPELRDRLQTDGHGWPHFWRFPDDHQ